MKKRTDKVEKKFESYNMKFANKSKEEMEVSIENLKEQIDVKKKQLRKIKDKTEKEKMENTIKKMEQEKNNMAGYTKNKEKIEKIRDYQDRLNTKIKPLIVEKNTLKKQLELNIQKNKDALQYIEKELNDTKKVERMSNEQYNNLLEEKETIENERKEIQNKIDKLQKKIDILSRASSKCNLAWKSLFNDKSWDEIHVRAMNGRYTKKETETTKQKEEANQENENIQATTGETRIAKTSKFRNRFPRISKMFDFAKNGFKKIGKIVKSEKLEITQEVEKQQESKRDTFVEELRRHVENDKGDKELEYIEKHKVKAKTKETKQEELEK